jgi:hypothetical protein
MAYELLTHREFDSQRLKVTEREDANWEICLVKEVHALLGTEGLLRRWKTPAVFILRDPVYIADSLFGAQTLQTHYLLRENLAVQQPEFLDRFARGRQRTVRRLLADVELRTPRERTILTRVMTMQLLQEMFALLAAEYAFVKALPYDEFCSAPREAFQTAARTLAISWDKDMENYLDQTMQADGTSGDPYSIMRNTSEQKHRPFKFFTPEEIAACRWVLGAMMG